MKTKTAILLSSLLALAACDGPWNMSPDTDPKPQRLWVSGFLVGGRAFDTLWIERPLPVEAKRDTASPFVVAAESRLRIVRTDVPDTIEYRLLPDYSSAWVPVDPARRVERGGRYRLEGRIRWSEYRGETRADSISATTFVPRTYALSDSIWAPIEALHPSLATGLPLDIVQKAASDPVYALKLWDSLNAIRPLGRYGLTLEDVATYLRGGEIYRPVAEGDTVFFITDPTPVRDPSGNIVQRLSRQFKFPQRFDREQWGGIFVTLANEGDGARIYDPLTQRFIASFGGDLDTSRLYQGEKPIPYDVLPAFIPNRLGYPDTVWVSNLFQPRTGRTTWHTYAFDSLYFEYWRSLTQSSGANNALRYSNVRGADGFFAGAAQDSFVVHVQATKDTIPYEQIRRVWCRDKLEQHLEDVDGDTVTHPWRIPPICVGRMPPPDSDE